MNEIEDKVIKAKEDNAVLEQLISDYLPFIKKQLQTFKLKGIEYEDLVSIGTLTFINCVHQYRTHTGGFLPFVKVSIRNKLIDTIRGEEKHGIVIPLHSEEPKLLSQAEEALAGAAYDAANEKARLRDEIDSLRQELSLYSISLLDLSEKSPKHKSARLLCLKAARTVYLNEAFSAQITQSRRLPQKELADALDISVKTVEKHRKYIIALFLLLSGDYPCIRAFLPNNETEEVNE